jgi:outer membrane protein assembly factor BamA
MDSLVGYDGVRNTYGELELRFDSRRRASEWEPVSVPATGWLAGVFAGRVTALDDGADFWRYGMDLQKFTSLGEGPRVLVLRTHGEAVTGETTDVPFIELPRIGGGTTLRGYAVDRFRDRVAITGSAEYQWDLSHFVSASLFVDAGKVAPSLRDLDVHDLRVGYGASVELHSSYSFLARATLASSIDGGLFFTIGLDPVFELEGRTERR